jgi:zinc protease
MLRSLCLLSLLLVSPLAAWPQEKSDLKPDPKAVFGALDNGLRYVILPNDEPPGRASLRIYMDVGSLMEDDDQQGMAHYLEHMAFNGSRHFPGGEMVEYFQRLGMAFGADTNAHTSFKETVYMLELPRVEPKLIGRRHAAFPRLPRWHEPGWEGDRPRARHHPQRKAQPRFDRLPHDD